MLHRALAEWTHAPLLGTSILDEIFEEECERRRIPEGYRTEAVRLELRRHFRGFIEELADVPDNAHGFRQNIKLTDFYLDSHLSWKLHPTVVFLAGADYLFGNGNSSGADFDYTVPLNGAFAAPAEAPSGSSASACSSRSSSSADSACPARDTPECTEWAH